jgi:hypothetical protein
MQLYQVCKVIIVKRQFSLSNNETYYQSNVVFYSRGMAITHSDELRHSPSAHGTKSSSLIIAIITRSLSNILFDTFAYFKILV